MLALGCLPTLLSNQLALGPGCEGACSTCTLCGIPALRSSATFVLHAIAHEPRVADSAVTESLPVALAGLHNFMREEADRVQYATLAH